MSRFGVLPVVWLSLLLAARASGGTPMVDSAVAWTRSTDGVTAGVPVVAKARRTVTVANFLSPNVPAGDADAITNLLRAELDGYTSLRTVFGPKEARCLTLPCAIDIGHQAKADFVIVGTLARVTDRYFISASLVDVPRSRIVGYENIAGDDVDELEAGLKKFAARIEKALR